MPVLSMQHYIAYHQKLAGHKAKIFNTMIKKPLFKPIIKTKVMSTDYNSIVFYFYQSSYRETNETIEFFCLLLDLN
jgi:hypothetical protein